MHFEKHLSHAIRTNGGALRPEADNLGDALDMIDEDVPDSLPSAHIGGRHSIRSLKPQRRAAKRRL